MPIWIGERLILASPGDAEYVRDDPRTVVLDAGQTFGTGTHPTTQMCLLELQAHLQEGDQVLDVGTGSGILAVAAARMGAARVVAVDVSLVACRVAQCNVRRNDLDDVVAVVAGTLVAIRSLTPFDLVVANLPSAAEGSRWLGDLSRHCRPEGKVILSGILAQDAGPSPTILRDAGLAGLARRIQGDWIALVLGKAH